MGEEVYINPKNMDSIIFKFEIPESATVFNYLREKFGPAFFNNLNNVSMNTWLSFHTKNPPYPHGINKGRIFTGTSYSLSLDCYEIDRDRIDEDNHIRVRPNLIYSISGKVPDELMQYVTKGRLVVRDVSIITDLLSEGTEGIELNGVGKIKVEGNGLDRETDRISLEYRFRDDLLKGVDAYIRREYKGSRNMKKYNQRFRVLFPNYDGILSPEALAGWKGLNQQFEKGKIFLLDQEVKQKEAIDEIVDVLGTKLWTEFEEAVALVIPKAK